MNEEKICIRCGSATAMKDDDICRMCMHEENLCADGDMGGQS